MKTYVGLWGFLISSWVSEVEPLAWKPCPGVTTKGTVKNVVAEGCESGSVCNIPRGVNQTIRIDFTPDVDTQSAECSVYGVVMGIPMPFDLPDKNICEDKDSGVQCPLKAGSLYSYSKTIFICPNCPLMSAKVRWQIQDVGSKASLACIEFQAKLVASRTSSKVLMFKSSNQL